MVELLKVIKFEGGDDTLVYKHPDEDFNTKSQLIVHQSQEAILFKDGKALDLFGPGKYTLETENIPILRNLINIPTEGVSPFHCEVYFINKATSLNMEWGTNKRFQTLDPSFGIILSIGASGAMEFKITDSRKFLNTVVGTQEIIKTDKLLNYFKTKTTTRVKDAIATLMQEVSYFNVTTHLDEISEAIENKLNSEFEEYGVKLVNFYVNTIFAPDEDINKLKEVLNKKMEYGTLNFNWADEQLAEIIKKYAENEGTQDGVSGMITQIPLAIAFGEMLKNGVVNEIKSPFSNPPQSFTTTGNTQQKPVNTPEVPKEEPVKVPEVPKEEPVTNTIVTVPEVPKEEPVNQEPEPTPTTNTETNTHKHPPKFCTKCGNKLNPTSKFCSQCGVKIDRELKCPDCGFKVQSIDKFCENCGRKL